MTETEMKILKEQGKNAVFEKVESVLNKIITVKKGEQETALIRIHLDENELNNLTEEELAIAVFLQRSLKEYNTK